VREVDLDIDVRLGVSAWEGLRLSDFGNRKVPAVQNSSDSNFESSGDKVHQLSYIFGSVVGPPYSGALA
jgi:hypothetical protein